MKIVGLTGGIGSGKSIVARFMEVLNVPVYYSDEKAKFLMNNNQQLITQIKKLLGKNAYINDQLNRSYVGKKVFNDKALLNQLNQIVHPIVKSDFKTWSKQHLLFPFVVQEAAILFENGNYTAFDHMVLVKAPIEQRIKRVMDRDNVSRENVIERMNNQWNDERKEALSDTLIINDNKHSIIDQTLILINKL